MTQGTVTGQPASATAADQHPIAMGIVGSGRIAIAHARAYAAMPDVDLLAVADVVPERAAAFCNGHAPGARAYGSLSDMVAAERLAAVSVCVQNFAHHPVVVQALAAGLHVFCEKPPALSAAQASEMHEAARKAKRVLAYGLVYRHLVQSLLPFVEEIGPIYRAHAEWTRARGIPGWGTYGTAAVTGGGVLADLGVHILDTAWVLMGRPAATQVSARTWRHKAMTSSVGLLGAWAKDAFEVEDHVTATVDFADARLSLEAAYATDTAAVETAVVELQGVNGRLVVPLVTTQREPDSAVAPRLYSERHRLLTATTIGPPWPRTILDGYFAELAAFADACRGATPPIADSADGVVIQTLLDTLYASAARSGDAIQL